MVYEEEFHHTLARFHHLFRSGFGAYLHAGVWSQVTADHQRRPTGALDFNQADPAVTGNLEVRVIAEMRCGRTGLTQGPQSAADCDRPRGLHRHINGDFVAHSGAPLHERAGEAGQFTGLPRAALGDCKHRSDHGTFW